MKFKSLLNNIFSIKKQEPHYVITILGIKFKKRSIMLECFLELNQNLEKMMKKMSMNNDIWQVDDVLFYVPNYPCDWVQSQIVNNNNFYDYKGLGLIKNYIKDNSVIVDVGANIGNHSLYFAKKCNAQKIYAFEAISSTFEILKRNIEINDLDNVVCPFNLGLSNEKFKGKISKFSQNNIGETSIQKSEKGHIALDKLDNIDIKENRIDFIKIDVEGHELLVLAGAKEALKKYKPIVYIEIFPNNFEEVRNLLFSVGYSKIAEKSGDNYIFI